MVGDYEQCATCGFDHEYEFAEAHAEHIKMTVPELYDLVAQYIKTSTVSDDQLRSALASLGSKKNDCRQIVGRLRNVKRVIESGTDEDEFFDEYLNQACDSLRRLVERFTGDELEYDEVLEALEDRNVSRATFFPEG